MGRPVSIFHDVIGQGRIIRMATRLVNGAKLRGERCPDFLLFGGSGLGKSTVARALSVEYGTRLNTIWATSKTSAIDLAIASEKLAAFDFIFIDECHNLAPDVQELVFRMMSECKAPKVEKRPTGGFKVVGEVAIPPVTFVVGTDQPGKLTNAFRKRFANTFVIQPYTPREMIAIIRHRATQLQMIVTAQAAKILASYCRGIPRNVSHHLEGMRLFLHDRNVSQFTSGHVNRFLRAKGFDHYGRDSIQRAYMDLLRKHGGKNVSLESLALALQLDPRMVRADVEPWLVQQAWISIAPSGRCLTKQGEDLITGKEEK